MTAPLTAKFPSNAAIDDAVHLLDRALADQQRAVRYAEGSVPPPLLWPEMRWDIVREARDALARLSR